MNSADNNVLYTVMAVILIVWAGIAAYMFSLDRRLKKIEKEINGGK